MDCIAVVCTVYDKSVCIRDCQRLCNCCTPIHLLLLYPYPVAPPILPKRFSIAAINSSGVRWFCAASTPLLTLTIRPPRCVFLFLLARPLAHQVAHQLRPRGVALGLSVCVNHLKHIKRDVGYHPFASLAQNQSSRACGSPNCCHSFQFNLSQARSIAFTHSTAIDS